MLFFCQGASTNTLFWEEVNFFGGKKRGEGKKKALVFIP
jgi:hypothetical protein